MAGGVEHHTGKQGNGCGVAEEEEGDRALQVEEEDGGQQQHCDRRLQKLQPGHGPEEPHVWLAVDHGELLPHRGAGGGKTLHHGRDDWQRGFDGDKLDGPIRLQPVRGPTPVETRPSEDQEGRPASDQRHHLQGRET